MNKTTAIIIGILAVIIIIFAAVGLGKKDTSENVTPEPGTEQVASIEGCYAATDSSKDIYSATIQSQQGTAVTGTLSFHNAEKDSSKGTFKGTYENGILLGDYSFQSEGMNSVMQVAFKKSGNDFIRGYGALTGDGTRFANVNALTYDASAPLSVFKKVQCEATTSSATTVITYPKGGEKLVAGQSYTLSWTGGPDTIQISLIDTSLESVGASVSVSDSVYGLKNTGTYKYTVPKTLKPGVYKFQIGNSTSNTFTVSK